METLFTEEERAALQEISVSATLAKLTQSQEHKIVSRMTNELAAEVFGKKVGKNFPGGHGAYATFLYSVTQSLSPVVKKVIAKAKEIGA